MSGYFKAVVCFSEATRARNSHIANSFQATGEDYCSFGFSNKKDLVRFFSRVDDDDGAHLSYVRFLFLENSVCSVHKCAQYSFG